MFFWCIDLLCMICITSDITWNNMPSCVFFTCAVRAEIFARTITFLLTSRFEWIGSRTWPRTFLKEKWQHFPFLSLVLQYFYWKTRYFSFKILIFIKNWYFLLRLSKKSCFWITFFCSFMLCSQFLAGKHCSCMIW